MGGQAAASFSVSNSTGQINTKSGLTYDYEARPAYSLTVKATDDCGLTDSIAITVGLTDVAETPVTACETTVETLPAAVANSGAGGPYEYLLKHKGAGKNFEDRAINGLSFDAATRTLSGTPTAAGVWQLSYVVHDDDDDRSVADRFRARTNLQVTVSQ